MTTRQEQCKEALNALNQATAMDVAHYLYDKGYSRLLERNIAHPRLNELVKDGIVKTNGTKWDEVTKRNVTVYTLK